MIRSLFLLCFLTGVLAVPARGLDVPGLPVRLSFQLGFTISAIPSPNDASRAHGLYVETEKIISDKQRSLVLVGTITNFGNAPCEGVDMVFDVTSYVGIDKSKGRAVVEPSSIPPGGVAAFTAHISLASPRPQFAMYTVTAASPLQYVAEPETMISAPVEDGVDYEPVEIPGL